MVQGHEQGTPHLGIKVESSGSEYTPFTARFRVRSDIIFDMMDKIKDG